MITEKLQRLLLGLTAFLSMAGSAVAQADSVTPGQGMDCSGYGRPLLLYQGMRHVVGCDSVYILNPFRYRLYREAAEVVLGMEHAADQGRLAQLEGHLKLLGDRGLRMAAAYDSLERVSMRTVREQEQLIRNLRSDLGLVREDLESGRQRVAVMERDLKRAQQTALRRNMIWAGGGLAAGFVLGIVLLQ